MVVIEGKKKI